MSVHPVISKMDAIKHNHYLAHETLRILRIPFSFNYPVIIESDYNNKIIIMHATVLRFNKIELNFKIEAGEPFSLITETIHFKTLLPIKPIMQMIFRKQHRQLFINIEQLPN